MIVEDTPTSSQANVVFVVHGRNLEARNQFFEFLRAIGLHPLEWSEAISATGRPTPHIDEILDAAFEKAGAVVVLLTPDDEARLRKPYQTSTEAPHELNLTGQARPNVLFESGMAMARHQDRTVLVELGELRPFSDIAGRYVVKLDNSTEKRQLLAQRLRDAGCSVNLEGTAWHSVGDFDSVIAKLSGLDDEFASSSINGRPGESAVGLSDDAIDLLLEAARGDGTIDNYRTMTGVHIRTRNRSFSEPGDARLQARWSSALQELKLNGLVQALSAKEQRFEVTHAGYTIADPLIGQQA